MTINIKKLAEECGIAESFEYNIFECTLEDLEEFAEKVIEKYEEPDEEDPIGARNAFERYGV